jgi:hypothetical protein
LFTAATRWQRKEVIPGEDARALQIEFMPGTPTYLFLDACSPHIPRYFEQTSHGILVGIILESVILLTRIFFVLCLGPMA